MDDKSRRIVSAKDVLEWNTTPSPMIRVRTDRDVVPGGLAMAMAPMVVKWTSSSPGFDPDDSFEIHRVNVANNPVGGFAILGGIRIPADAVESVQFVMVMSKVARRESPAGHAMLRFLFRDDRLPVLLDREGQPFENDSPLKDIVLSWEAWRPPEARFDPVKGLDPETYALTPRCYVGSVRCLADSILDRPWRCYPLKLPDVEHSASEVLYLSLALADAVARHTIMYLLKKRIERGREMPEGYPDPEAHEWETVLEQLKEADVPENPIRDILNGKIRYHLLERSCITMALYSVDWAIERIHRRAGFDDPKHIRVLPEAMPPFMTDMATGRRTATLLRAPALLHWIMTHQTVIPSKAPELLDEAGLLHREGGRIKEYHYDNRRQTPYGEIADHIIY